jgi:hypothetical protein
VFSLRVGNLRDRFSRNVIVSNPRDPIAAGTVARIVKSGVIGGEVNEVHGATPFEIGSRK